MVGVWWWGLLGGEVEVVVGWELVAGEGWGRCGSVGDNL